MVPHHLAGPMLPEKWKRTNFCVEVNNYLFMINKKMQHSGERAPRDALVIHLHNSKRIRTSVLRFTNISNEGSRKSSLWHKKRARNKMRAKGLVMCRQEEVGEKECVGCDLSPPPPHPSTSESPHGSLPSLCLCFQV